MSCNHTAVYHNVHPQCAVTVPTGDSIQCTRKLYNVIQCLVSYQVMQYTISYNHTQWYRTGTPTMHGNTPHHWQCHHMISSQQYIIVYHTTPRGATAPRCPQAQRVAREGIHALPAGLSASRVHASGMHVPETHAAAHLLTSQCSCMSPSCAQHDPDVAQLAKAVATHCRPCQTCARRHTA